MKQKMSSNPVPGLEMANFKKMKLITCYHYLFGLPPPPEKF